MSKIERALRIACVFMLGMVTAVALDNWIIAAKAREAAKWERATVDIANRSKEAMDVALPALEQCRKERLVARSPTERLRMAPAD